MARGFFNILARELDRSIARSQAQSRTPMREAARARAAAERKALRAERAAQLRQIRASEAVARAQTKRAQREAEKEARRREAILEVDEAAACEEEIDRIGNESPEVEDRERLYAELSIRRTFDAEAVVAQLNAEHEQQVVLLSARGDADLQRRLAAFRPNLRVANGIQAMFWLLAAGGVVVGCSPYQGGGLMLLVGAIGGVASHLLSSRVVDVQRAGWEGFQRAEAEEAVMQELSRLGAELAVRVPQTVESARADFEGLEDQRLVALRDLQAGVLTRMQDVLVDTLLALELPVGCGVSVAISSPTEVIIELEVPDASVLPSEELKLLSSGKVSRKQKSEKRRRDQYTRLLAGLALRYASESMLYLPTTSSVEVRLVHTGPNPATGKVEPRPLLTVTYDYATLAPLTMDRIDPVAALQHFPHRPTLKGKDLEIVRA